MRALVAHIGPEPPGLRLAGPGARIGTVVSSPCSTAEPAITSSRSESTGDASGAAVHLPSRQGRGLQPTSSPIRRRGPPQKGRHRGRDARRSRAAGDRARGVVPASGSPPQPPRPPPERVRRLGCLLSAVRHSFGRLISSRQSQRAAELHLARLPLPGSTAHSLAGTHRSDRKC